MNHSASTLSTASDTGSHSETTIAGQVRVGQIITFALVQGVILITALLTFLAFGNDGGEQNAAGEAAGDAAAERLWAGGGDLALMLIGLAGAAGAGVAAIVVTGAMRRQAIEKFRASGEMIPVPVDPTTPLPPASAQLLGACFASTLIGQSLTEGAAILNAILMLIDPHWVYLIAIAIMLAGLARQTPTVGKVQQVFETAVRR